MIKVVILSRDVKASLFPYFEVGGQRSLKVSNENILDKIIASLQGDGLSSCDIDIIVSKSAEELGKHYADKDNIKVLRLDDGINRGDTFKWIVNHCIEEENEYEQVLLLNGTTLCSSSDISNLLQQESDNSVLIQELDALEEAEKPFVVLSNDRLRLQNNLNYSGKFYKVVASLLQVDVFKKYVLAQYSSDLGFTPNFGVNSFSASKTIEKVLESYQQDGNKLNIVFGKERVFFIDRLRDILSANYHYNSLYCQKIDTNSVGKKSKIERNSKIKGKVILGDNSFIDSSVIIKGNCIIGDNTIIRNGAIVGENVIIGDNCVVEDYCKISAYTTIGDNSIISHGANVEGILLGGNRLYSFSVIQGVIGYGSSIGSGVSFSTLKPVKSGIERFDANNFSNASYIGNECWIGASTVIMPAVVIGNHTTIGAGMIINNNIASNKLVYSKQEVVTKSWGK